jgi:hypothetical protein
MRVAGTAVQFEALLIDLDGVLRVWNASDEPIELEAGVLR